MITRLDVKRKTLDHESLNKLREEAEEEIDTSTKVSLTRIDSEKSDIQAKLLFGNMNMIR
jgi:hypothetical protein